MSLIDVFADNYEIPDEDLSKGKLKASLIRCKCGHVVEISKPTKCDKCGDYKCYWQMIDGSIKALADMDLGHLTNTVRMLGRKLEIDGPRATQHWRAAMELAIDLFYREIGSRDTEIAQASGIMSALNRSLETKEPEDC